MSQNPNTSKDFVCWHCGNVVESRESVRLRWNPKQRRQRKAEEWHGKGAGSLEQGEQAAVAEPQPQPALASSLDLASSQTLVRSPHLEPEGWLKWTHDTGAAISAFPLDGKSGTETQANEWSYKTASGELISDRGGVREWGTSEYGYGVTFQGRKADVHKALISASKVHSKGRVAVVDSNGGYIIFYNSTLARKSQQLVQKEVSKEFGATRLYLENGTPKSSRTFAHEAIKNCVQCMQNNSRGPSAPSMASVGKAHSCPLAHWPETKLPLSDRGSATQCCCGRTWADQAGS